MSVRLFKSLLYKSAQLQQEIEWEYRRRRPDNLRLLKLKKIRLYIKDRLRAIIMAGQTPIADTAMKPQPILIKKM